MHSSLDFPTSTIEPPCSKNETRTSVKCQDSAVGSPQKAFLSGNVIASNSEGLAPEDLLQNMKYETDPYDIDKLIQDIQEEDVISGGSPISGNNDLDFIASINVPCTDSYDWSNQQGPI